MTKKSRKNVEHLQNEKSFSGEIKSIFHHFLQSFQLLEIVSDLKLCFTEKTLISTKHWRKYIREMCLDSLLGSACVLPQTSLSQNKKSYKTKEMSFSQSKTRFWPALYGNIPPSWSNYNLIEKPSTLLF